MGDLNLGRMVYSIDIIDDKAVNNLKKFTEESKKVKTELTGVDATNKQAGLSFGQMAGAVAMGQLAFKALESTMVALKTVTIDFAKASMDASAQLERNLAIMNNTSQIFGRSSAESQNFINTLEKMGFTLNESSAITTQSIRNQYDFADSLKMSQIAMDLSATSGQSAGQVWDSLNMSIETGMTKQLRQYDMIFSADVALQSYANSIGKAKDQLDEFDKKQAIFEAILAEGTKFAGNYSKQLETWQGSFDVAGKSVEKLKIALGESFSPALTYVGQRLALVGKALTENIYETVTDGDKVIVKLNARFQALADTILNVVIKGFEMFAQVGVKVFAFLSAYGTDMIEIGGLTAEVVLQIVQLVGVMLSAFGSAFSGIGTTIGNNQDDLADWVTTMKWVSIQNQAVLALIEVSIKGTILSMTGVLGVASQIIDNIGAGIATVLNGIITSWNSVISGMANSYNAMPKQIKDLLGGGDWTTTGIIKGQVNIGQAGWKNPLSEIDSAYNEYSKKIDSINAQSDQMLVSDDPASRKKKYTDATNEATDFLKGLEQKVADLKNSINKDGSGLVDDLIGSPTAGSGGGKDGESDAEKVEKERLEKLRKLEQDSANATFDDQMNIMQKIQDARDEMSKKQKDEIEVTVDYENLLTKELSDRKLTIEDLVDVWNEGYDSVEQSLTNLEETHKSVMQSMDDDIQTVLADMQKLTDSYLTERKDSASQFSSDVAQSIADTEMNVQKLWDEFINEEDSKKSREIFDQLTVERQNLESKKLAQTTYSDFVTKNIADTEANIKKIKEDYAKETDENKKIDLLEQIALQEKALTDQQMSINDIEKKTEEAKKYAQMNDLEKLVYQFTVEQEEKSKQFQFDISLLTQRQIQIGLLKDKEVALNNQKQKELEGIETKITTIFQEQLNIREIDAMNSIQRISSANEELLRKLQTTSLKAFSAQHITEGGQLVQLESKASGGFTQGLINKIAGVVHGGEWVAPNWLVNNMPSLFSSLENMRMQGFANGGYVNNNSSTYNQPITINASNGSDLDYRFIGRQLHYLLR